MITSLQNSKVKTLRQLSGRPKDRREAGSFVAEGIRLLEEALLAGSDNFQFVLASPELTERGRGLVANLEKAGVEVEQASPAIFEALAEGGSSQGVIAAIKMREFQLEKYRLVLIPDAMRDPGNLGSLLRSAAAAGFQAVWLPPETTDAFAPKVVRAGMGAHFRLALHTLTWDQIRQAATGIPIYLAEVEASHSCWDTSLLPPLVLIIGGEAEGATAEARGMADRHISIPMPGRAESLNAAAAGAILMFEIVRQMREAGQK